MKGIEMFGVGSNDLSIKVLCLGNFTNLMGLYRLIE
jgi:hypothetical protein